MSADKPRARLRICLDADALFAGAASTSGASHLILQLGELGIIEVGVPDQARAEAERNLAAKLPAALPAFRAVLEACCVGLPMASSAESVAIAESGEADAKDAPILASALAASCRWLVTFNLRDYRSDRIRVSNPSDFIEALRGELLQVGLS
ncbi:MAG: PIN domain-containing protein [Chloroflexi bacterium]|nr:PIN domain-containing protein [Chloroflexota bacterium]